MTFLALDMNKNFLVMQKSQFEYQQCIASSNQQYVTSKLAGLPPETDMESQYVQMLQYQQQLYDQQLSAIESQLKVINAQIDNYNKAIGDNAKKDGMFFSYLG